MADSHWIEHAKLRRSKGIEISPRTKRLKIRGNVITRPSKQQQALERPKGKLYGK